MRVLSLLLIALVLGCGSSSSGSSSASGDGSVAADTSSKEAATCKESLASFTARIPLPLSGHPYTQGTAFCAAAGISSGYIGASSCDMYEGANFARGGKNLLLYFNAGSGALVGVFEYDTGECLAGDGERCGDEIGIGVDCSKS
ncbi:MAG: hypothetical protein ACXVEF_37800 [Polyangiales bacterium]